MASAPILSVFLMTISICTTGNISDLGSTNETLLNSELLMPHTDRLIRSGDRVRLGDLSMMIIFPAKADFSA